MVDNGATKFQQGYLCLFALLLRQPKLLIQSRKRISGGRIGKQREFYPRGEG
jgi:hypothetical protein